MAVSGNIITGSRYDGVGFSTSTGTIDSLGRNGIVISPPFCRAPSGFLNDSGGFTATVSGNNWQNSTQEGP